MRASWPYALLLWCASTACERGHESRDEDHGHAREHGASHAHAAADEGHGHEEAEPHEEERTLQFDPEMQRDLRVTYTTAEQRAGGEGVVVLGELRPNDAAYAEVGSAVPARVARLHVEVGDRVGVGQPLVELESAEVGRARASYVAALAHAEAAEQSLERRRGLAAERIVSQRELEETEASAKSARAEVRAARAALRALGVSDEDVAESEAASRFTLRSPISGTVIARNASRGTSVDPARAVLEIADLATLWLVAHAFERDAVRVLVGGKARVSFAALPGVVLPGEVTLVGKQVDVASRTIPIRIVVANGEGLLRPGMSGSAWLPLGGSDARVVTVPSAAVQRLERDWVVFVPRDGGVFEVRAVGRGRDLGGEVEIISGVEPGERVVLDGAFVLKAEAEKRRGGGEEHHH